MSDTDIPDYPFCLPSYVAAFDDGQLAEQELKAEIRSWRSEGYADDSNVRIFDHHRGEGKVRLCHDEEIDRVLVRLRTPISGSTLTG
jgi:hypothetical protein